MNDYPKVATVFSHTSSTTHVTISLDEQQEFFLLKNYARDLATKLVAEVGCEQLTEERSDGGEQAERLFLELAAARKQNKELVELLYELDCLRRGCSEEPCPNCNEPGDHDAHAPDCRLRAALEGR